MIIVCATIAIPSKYNFLVHIPSQEDDSEQDCICLSWKLPLKYSIQVSLLYIANDKIFFSSNKKWKCDVNIASK